MERYHRCLDLYLAPRYQRKIRKVLDAEKLLPKLPKPEELRPYPDIASVVFQGHTHIVRTISLDPTGKWLISGSDDQSIRLWEVETGRCTKIWNFPGAEISWVEWNPSNAINLFAAAVDEKVYLIQPLETGTDENNSKTAEFFPNSETLAQLAEEDANIVVTSKTKSDRSKTLLEWQYQTKKEMLDQGIKLILSHLNKVTQVTWHKQGDYFCSLSPQSYNDGIIIHRLSKATSQKPFKKAQKFKGIKLVRVMFHPKKPLFFVVSQVRVKIYNLARQTLHKKLKGRIRLISSMDIHPSGNHILVGGFDKKVEWFDIELSSTPFKSLRYHSKAVRSVAFHQTYPLFATCSDDAYIRIFHCSVFEDWLKDPLIVPLKIMKPHRQSSDLGILDLKFHPIHPWLFTSGADQTIRMFI